MNISDAIVDYLLDIKHLAKKSQLLYQQHLTLFAEWANLQGVSLEQVRTLSIGNVTLAKGVNEDSYIKVMGKRRREREIPIGSKTRRALSRYMRSYRKDAKKSDPVFLSRYGGQMAHETFKDVLLRLKNILTFPAGVQLNPHKFKHTFATR